MNIYLAKILFQIVCGEGSHIPQFDEQLRIIQAKDPISAFKKAQSIGRLEENCFQNIHFVPVYWKFINVSDIYSLDKTTDGAEVYSRIYEEEDADRLVQRIHSRAEKILQNNSFPSPFFN